MSKPASVHATCQQVGCKRAVKLGGGQYCKSHIPPAQISLGELPPWFASLPPAERYALTQPQERRSWGKPAQREASDT